MFISKICTLTQTRMGVGRVTFSSKGHMRVSMSPLWKNAVI